MSVVKVIFIRLGNITLHNYITLDIAIFNNSFLKEIMNVRSYCAEYYLLSDTKTTRYLK